MFDVSDDRSGGLHGSRARVPRWGAHGVSNNLHQPHVSLFHIGQQVVILSFVQRLQ